MAVGTNDGDGGAGVLDLAAWRAEAVACAPLDAAATRGPWEDMFAHWGKAEVVHFNSLPYDDRANTINGRQYDRVAPYIEPRNAAFIAAARTGWPRDAARVLALVDRCAALEEALAEALDGWEGTVSDVGFTSYHTIKRLRALAAGGAGEGESR